MSTTLKVFDQRLTGHHLWQYSVSRRWVPVVEVYDPNGHDGEWHATVRLAHEIVEHEGYGVPAFEGDTERIEWGKRRR